MILLKFIVMKTEKREIEVEIAGKKFTLYTAEDEQLIRRGENLVNERWNKAIENLKNVDSFSRLLLLAFDLAVEVAKQEDLKNELNFLDAKSRDLLEKAGGVV